MRSLAQWLEYLERLHPTVIDMGLDRVAAVRDRLGIRLDMPVISVGGTNGKGSVCAYLDAILRQAGYCSGLYTSPHLVHYNERVRIDGVEVSDALLIEAFERIEQARGTISLTYFEFGTLAATLIFRDAQVEVVVLELGLGGRLDAVNIFDADCAVIVSVDLDHMNFLGNTRDSIGYEKAGIFRAGQPGICADPDPPGTLIGYAQAVGARLRLIGKDFGCLPGQGQWRYWGEAMNRGALPHPALRGSHQLANAATAIAALDTLRLRLPVSVQAIRMGLATVTLPGRFQVLPGRPTVVLDVAHNPHAARAMAQCLAEHKGFRRTWAVFGMLSDKDIVTVIDVLKDRIDAWYVASLPGGRGTSNESLAALIASRDSGKPVYQFASVEQAYRCAHKRASEDDRILVFGSFHTVSEVLVLRAKDHGPGHRIA